MHPRPPPYMALVIEATQPTPSPAAALPAHVPRLLAEPPDPSAPSTSAAAAAAGARVPGEAYKRRLLLLWQLLSPDSEACCEELRQMVLDGVLPAGQLASLDLAAAASGGDTAA